MVQNVKYTKYTIRHWHVQYTNPYDKLHVDQNTVDWLNKQVYYNEIIIVIDNNDNKKAF